MNRAVPWGPDPQLPLNPAMDHRVPHTGRLASGHPAAAPVALAPSIASCSADRNSEAVAPQCLRSVVDISPGPTSPSPVSCAFVATGRLAPPGASALCAVVVVRGAGKCGVLEVMAMRWASRSVLPGPRHLPAERPVTWAPVPQPGSTVTGVPSAQPSVGQASRDALWSALGVGRPFRGTQKQEALSRAALSEAALLTCVPAV